MPTVKKLQESKKRKNEEISSKVVNLKITVRAKAFVFVGLFQSKAQ